MNKYLLIGIIAILIIAGRLWYSDRSNTPVTPENAESGLLTNLQGITPQFIDEHTSVPPNILQEIRQDIIEILVAQKPENREYYSQNSLDLLAIGKRYVAFRVLRPTGSPAPIQIFDSVTQKSDQYITEELLFKTDKIAVFVDSQNIYTYKPDDAAATLLSEAKLSGYETYDHCGGCIAGIQDLQATYTDTSFTISTFKWVQGVPQKVRDLTFTLQ